MERAVFHPCAASCALLDHAPKKSHEFSLQPKLQDGNDALGESRDVTGCLNPSFSWENLCRETKFKPYP